MFEMIWIVTAGIYMHFMSETTTFKSLDECQAFGRSMSARAVDYSRGALGLDWKDDVRVQAHCRASGQPV